MLFGILALLGCQNRIQKAVHLDSYFLLCSPLAYAFSTSHVEQNVVSCWQRYRLGCYAAQIGSLVMFQDKQSVPSSRIN